MEAWLLAALAAPAAFFTVFFMTPPLIGWLRRRDLSVRDVNKPGRVMVARPGGISIMAGILAAEAVLYAAFQSVEVLAITATTAGAFAAGLLDDRRVMSGWFKPLALAAASAPIIVLGAYDPHLSFPLFGSVHIPILYLAVAALMIPITGNTINSIDVLNGVSSGFMVIAGAALTISLVIIGNYEMAAVSMPLPLVALAFYRYHKNPSRIFPGDSGALALGAMYGAIALAGGVEIIAAVALLPAVINSFLFLSSMRRIVEHRQIKARPVETTDDFHLRATREKGAPVTLVRLILARGPMKEAEVARSIFLLAAFSGILAVITAAMTAAWP
ncbi:UDP-N-acetylglucosamine-1-phosphate transferase [Cenarchaeum symbiosum A]|uniref:UDP-N-acetylglucosamine-1-phosphate transferase n=1 Tax=Cenarchaeum symbiosum (strain A) TaxID=414004 RepID=A0RYB6_CENSY|nr:UDP-N-acetylglucosamine-1-phosphate transferase [Cenarchaeum symbiosum A]